MTDATQGQTAQKFDFKLKKIVWEKMHWQIIVDIESLNSEMAMQYRLSFVPNVSGYAYRIKDLEKEIMDIETNVQDSLLPDEKEGEILERKNKIASVRIEMQNFLNSNPPIMTLASLRELKRRGETDRVSFEINSGIIPALNEKSFMLDHSYHLILEDPSIKTTE